MRAAGLPSACWTIAASHEDAPPRPVEDLEVELRARRGARAHGEDYAACGRRRETTFDTPSPPMDTP
jgi:hypothetical protein